MDFINEWTYGVCITLIICVIISLLLPEGVMGKYGRAILSLFILISFITPFVGSDISFALPDNDITLSEQEQEEDTYSSLIAAKVKSLLEEGGYNSANVKCSVSVEDEEIAVTSLTISIPDEYSKEEVRDYIYDSIGMSAEVYYVGE